MTRKWINVRKNWFLVCLFPNKSLHRYFFIIIKELLKKLKIGSYCGLAKWSRKYFQLRFSKENPFFSILLIKMENSDGQLIDLYIPRKW
jgi:hypothetical protein